MLREIDAAKESRGGKFAIVAARYNPEYTDALVNTCRAELETARADLIEVIRVPGSFEVPGVAARLARSGMFDAVICIGVILRGQTTHAQQIADSVSNALAQLQIQYALPVIHAVLLFENHEQAQVRCLGRDHNRGLEAARVAIEMRQIMRNVDNLIDPSRDREGASKTTGGPSGSR